MGVIIIIVGIMLIIAQKNKGEEKEKSDYLAWEVRLGT